MQSLSVYDKEHLYLNFPTKIFQKSSSITRIYKTVIFLQIDRYAYSISHSVTEFGANMAQVTLGKFFSKVLQKWKSDGNTMPTSLGVNNYYEGLFYSMNGHCRLHSSALHAYMALKNSG